MIPRRRSGVKPPAPVGAHDGGPAVRQEDGRRKPSSVRRPGGRVGSSVWDPDRSGPRAAYPGLERGRRPLVLYLALLRMGFAVRPLLPAARCALTAPFHPCLCPSSREAIGGLLSAALSVASRRPGVTRHPALRSSDFPPAGKPAGSRRRSLGPSSWTRTEVATVPSSGASPNRRTLRIRPLSAAMTGSRNPDTAGEATTTVNICLYILRKCLSPNGTNDFSPRKSAMPGRICDAGSGGREQGVTES